MKMNPGHFDRKVIIRNRVSSGNSFGAGGSEVFADFKTIWAKYQPMTGSERWASEGSHNIKSAKFTTYFDSSITETMMVRFDGLDWNILGLAEVGYRHLLEITAEVVK